MALARWKKISEEVVHANKHFSLHHDTFSLPNETRVRDYFYIRASDTVIVVPRTADGKIVFVNQYRYLYDRDCLELPMGGCESNDVSLEQAALRELEEETGYTGTLTSVGSYKPLNATMQAAHHVFVANQLQVQNRLSKDETEEFEVVVLKPSEVDEKIVSGVIWDGPTITAWALARYYFTNTVV
jgi:ADP-ribose pyrophosphatase